MRIVLFCFCLLALNACTLNNAEEDDSLGKYFQQNKLTGTFALFDNGSGKFTVYNMDRYRDSTYLPCSTFKIVNALVGLETGRVRDSSAVFKWDGVERPIRDWNQDLSMQQAFTLSAVPWYQQLARSIGKDTMQYWLDTLGYGGGRQRYVIGNNIDTFWLDNTLKVTADEQLGLVKKLYFGQLPFQARTQRIVTNMMKREDNANYRLSYKSGWGFTEKNHALGWLVGWAEENNHPYFFVLQVESDNRDYDFSTVRLTMLKDILAQLGFLEGKR